jgi:FAD synthase
MKFENVEALKAQMAEDIEKGRIFHNLTKQET